MLSWIVPEGSEGTHNPTVAFVLAAPITSTGKLKAEVARVSRDIADLVVSATDVAMAATIWLLQIAVGAEYNPVFEIVPAAGYIAQVTALLLAFDTEAVNC